MAEPTIALVEKPKAKEPWHCRTMAAILRAPADALSTSEVGQLVYHPECSQCEWRIEAYTFVEAEARSEKHRDDTGHRPVGIYMDTLRNFIMNVD